MEKIKCRAKSDSNLFLIGCILFSVNCLYYLWGTFNFGGFYVGIRLILGIAVCACFFLAYTEKVKLFVPFILIILNTLVGFVSGTVAYSGFFGFLTLAATVYTLLCVLGMIHFRMKTDFAKKIDVKANDPCIVAAVIFVILGIITAIKCLVYIRAGLPVLYVFSTLCYFGGAVLVLLGSEPEKEYPKAAANNANNQGYANNNWNYHRYNGNAQNSAQNNAQTQGTVWSYQRYDGNVQNNVQPNRSAEQEEQSLGQDIAQPEAQAQSEVQVQPEVNPEVKLQAEPESESHKVNLSKGLPSDWDKGVVKLGAEENPPQAEAVAETKPSKEKEEAEAKLSKMNNTEIIETIKKLAELKDMGILSEAEFNDKKTELLRRM